MTYAKALLDILHPLPDAQKPTAAAVEKALSDFIGHISDLHARHVTKPKSGRDLLDLVFGRPRVLDTPAKASPVAKAHLHAALEELKALESEIRGDNDAKVTMARLAPWKTILRDYVFDLADIANYLQRNVRDYVYLEGGKNAQVHSWEVFRLARSLAYQSTYAGRGSFLDNKAAQIASIAVLRQSMELRFERLIGVYPRDADAKSPRFRHGFHQAFIVAHPEYIKPQGFSFKDLGPVYDWCSEIVHQAYQPYAWQIARALKEAGQMMASRPAPANGAWSVANGVHVVRVADMQKAFEDHFLDTYGHGAWQLIRFKPEALTPRWTEPRPDLTFHPVRNPNT